MSQRVWAARCPRKPVLAWVSRAAPDSVLPPVRPGRLKRVLVPRVALLRVWVARFLAPRVRVWVVRSPDWPARVRVWVVRFPVVPKLVSVVRLKRVLVPRVALLRVWVARFLAPRVRVWVVRSPDWPAREQVWVVRSPEVRKRVSVLRGVPPLGWAASYPVARTPGSVPWVVLVPPVARPPASVVWSRVVRAPVWVLLSALPVTQLLVSVDLFRAVLTPVSVVRRKPVWDLRLVWVPRVVPD
ncbi:hypothetical protein EBN03_29085 [Nocardia stercoris]|uniref:Uncharacterized protein n=1 Tax=Nocardia stercoris TaxID=2483361 RepID=A0A3M2KW61_9NOCA|nr:hypothetical protein EBN03_29085 [Nocardia stercoris]